MPRPGRHSIRVWTARETPIFAYPPSISVCNREQERRSDKSSCINALAPFEAAHVSRRQDPDA